jgi:hypothetical protein
MYWKEEKRQEEERVWEDQFSFLKLVIVTRIGYGFREYSGYTRYTQRQLMR